MLILYCAFVAVGAYYKCSVVVVNKTISEKMSDEQKEQIRNSLPPNKSSINLRYDSVYVTEDMPLYVSNSLSQLLHDNNMYDRLLNIVKILISNNDIESSAVAVILNTRETYGYKHSFILQFDNDTVVVMIDTKAQYYEVHDIYGNTILDGIIDDYEVLCETYTTLESYKKLGSFNILYDGILETLEFDEYPNANELFEDNLLTAYNELSEDDRHKIMCVIYSTFGDGVSELSLCVDTTQYIDSKSPCLILQDKNNVYKIMTNETGAVLLRL